MLSALRRPQQTHRSMEHVDASLPDRLLQSINARNLISRIAIADTGRWDLSTLLLHSTSPVSAKAALSRMRTALCGQFGQQNRVRRLQGNCLMDSGEEDPATRALLPHLDCVKAKLHPWRPVSGLQRSEAMWARSSPSARAQPRVQGSTHPASRITPPYPRRRRSSQWCGHRCTLRRSCTAPTSLPAR